MNSKTNNEMNIEENIPRDKEIYSFTVLWKGWECASAAWIIERPDGSRYLVMTDHGSPYMADPNELVERIAEYQDVINQTNKALEILKENGPS